MKPKYSINIAKIQSYVEKINKDIELETKPFFYDHFTSEKKLLAETLIVSQHDWNFYYPRVNMKKIFNLFCVPELSIKRAREIYKSEYIQSHSLSYVNDEKKIRKMLKIINANSIYAFLCKLDILTQEREAAHALVEIRQIQTMLGNFDPENINLVLSTVSCAILHNI